MEQELNSVNCERCPSASVLSRREWLMRAAAALGVVVIGDVLSGCGSGPPEDNGDNGPPRHGPGPGGPPAQGVAATASGSGFLVPGGGKLAKGTALAFTYGPSREPGIVFVTAQGDLRALSARCTHAGCTVNWDAETTDPVLHCPCHGSNFDLTGQVKNGPAKRPLPSLTVVKHGSDALVTP